jgi:hypothetical protein
MFANVSVLQASLGSKAKIVHFANLDCASRATVGKVKREEEGRNLFHNVSGRFWDFRFVRLRSSLMKYSRLSIHGPSKNGSPEAHMWNFC